MPGGLTQGLAKHLVNFVSDRFLNTSHLSIYFCRQQEAEIASLTRRIRLVDEDFEQTSARLQTATDKLEEASKLAEETER